MDPIEPVCCSCSTCQTPVGHFENLWDKIGKTYYSPVYDNSRDARGFKVSGDVREGPRGTIIQDR